MTKAAEDRRVEAESGAGDPLVRLLRDIRVMERVWFPALRN